MQRREELLQVYNIIMIGDQFKSFIVQKKKSTRKYKDFLDILLSIKV